MEIDRTVRQIMDSNDRLDGIVFNAGVIHPISPILEANDTQWEENIHVNLLSIQKMTKGLMPLLVGTGRAKSQRSQVVQPFELFTPGLRIVLRRLV